MQLVSIETQEALTHLKGKLLPIIVILVCAIGSYFLHSNSSWFLSSESCLGLLGKSPLLGWELRRPSSWQEFTSLLIFIMKKKITSKLSRPSFRILPSRTRTRPRMDSRTKSQKQELVSRLAGYRRTLQVPDTRQILSQSKNLLHVAGKLPSTMQARPARTAMITAGVACLLVLLIKPKRRKRKERKERKAAVNAIADSRTVPRQLLAFSLAVSQPLARVWITERARRWMHKSSKVNNG